MSLSELQNQAVRLSTSVDPNIAERCAWKPWAPVNHLRIADSSAAETVAPIDIAFGDLASGLHDQLLRVSALLAGFIKPFEYLAVTRGLSAPSPLLLRRCR